MSNKKVTIRDVAARAGVSRATVSRVLNDFPGVKPALRERVNQAMDELGFAPNYFSQALAKGRSNSIGLMVRSLGGYFFGSIMVEVEEVLTKKGFHCMVCSGSGKYEAERAAVDFMLSRQVDAMILSTDCLSDEELIKINQSGTPVVLISRDIEEIRDQCIRFDDANGGYNATQHLIENGHRDIATVTGPMTNRDARSRLQGYRKALEDNDIPYRPELVLESNFQVPGGKQATEKLLAAGHKFSAVFYGSDEMAIGGVQALNQAGLSVPDDVSVIGFEDVPLNEFLKPQMSSMRIPVSDIGHLAAMRALSLVDQEPLDSALEVQVELMERESVIAT
ncbi:LacI family DNA-binding transcriptional regulator [Aliagarivorans taiwanensis]|uniref:LacI family DNA-binding transcriptional regulator n=1 Tax=Aliagarivorans taiwanensis TaxID=561966 RepID=UPI00047EBDB1|nr:LacI family DNA-binding transcriptional regulator [Aliagarivorans taiwanensis]